MNGIIAAVQLFFSIVIGMYFFVKLRSETGNEKVFADDNKREAEELNRLRKISLSKPLTEEVRPASVSEIVGQEDGIKALMASLCGEHPQHILIYGPPGVGKTAASRVALAEAKKSPNTPFAADAPFVEVDATVMQYDERCIADPLIGSVHDPIYQGAGAYGNDGIPQPKPGAVTRAHGGVLFVDEIGELSSGHINKLLKVLEDRRVMLESSYYSRTNKKIPTYIHDVFQNGLPADFRLIGATTRKPSEIPEAIRSRCVEIHFNELSTEQIYTIVTAACKKAGLEADNLTLMYISQYAKNGRDAVKLLQMLKNLVSLEGRGCASMADAKWVIGMLCPTAQVKKQGIIGVSIGKPNDFAAGV
ncbi:MAG: ATP-binding protein [Clostridiales bacterium]|nr:ATP-binding protein [Clostridiales bacterium]